MVAVLYKLSVGKVRWKLRTVMADRKITNKALAKELDMNPVSISKLKSNDDLPEIGGDALAKICEAITKLSERNCDLEELIEYVSEE